MAWNGASTAFQKCNDPFTLKVLTGEMHRDPARINEPDVSILKVRRLYSWIYLKQSRTQPAPLRHCQKLVDFYHSLLYLTENMKYHGIIPLHATAESAIH
jgi:hypothetical protein